MDIYDLNSPDVVNAVRRNKARSKWNVSKSRVKRQLDDYTFDSEAEARRYALLKLWEHVGEISNLMVHPTHVLIPAFTTATGRHSAVKFTPDFSYQKRRGDELVWIVEDVKPSKRTKTGKLRPLVSADFTVRRKMFQQARPHVEFLIACETGRDSWQEFKF